MNDASAKLTLSRVGAILAFLSVTIFGIGLVVQMTLDEAHASIYPILITGGAGLALLIGAAYLVLSSRRPVSADEASHSSVKMLQRAAIVAGLIVVVGGIASFVSGPDVITSVILVLVGLQAPIAMVMASGFIQNPRAHS